jgi:hypothetical protein
MSKHKREKCKLILPLEVVQSKNIKIFGCGFKAKYKFHFFII